jgi:hypothetical protein
MEKKVVESVFVGCLNDTLEADKIEVPISYIYIYIYIVWVGGWVGVLGGGCVGVCVCVWGGVVISRPFIKNLLHNHSVNIK